MNEATAPTGTAETASSGEPAPKTENTSTPATVNAAGAEKPAEEEHPPDEPPPAAPAEPAEAAEPPASTEPAEAAEPPASAEPAEAAEPPASAEPAEAAEPAGTAEPPAAAKRRKRTRAPLWARITVFAGALLLLAAGGALAATRVLVSRYDHSIHKEQLLAPQARLLDPPTQHMGIHGPLNFLLLGSDARADNPGIGERSDTVIILHVTADLDHAYLVSVPRDLRVKIPEYQATGFHGSREKINAAFQRGGGGIGGVQLLSQTLTDLTGVRFDGAAIIDFAGFQKVVDIMGGVDMCVDSRTHSIHTGAVYEPGCYRMRPWQALDYVRQRKDQPNGDYDRQRHQQQFLKALLTEAMSQGFAQNPLKVDQLIRAAGASLTVDLNGVPTMELVYALRGIGPQDVSGIRVPSEPKMIGNTSYVVGFDTEDESLYQAIRTDSLDTWARSNPDWVNPL